MATDNTIRNNPGRIQKLREHARELIEKLNELEGYPSESIGAVTAENQIRTLLNWMHDRTGVSRHQQRSASVTHAPVRIRDAGAPGGVMTINAVDYDPAVHELAD
jgi:hypothetical protein